MNLAISDDHIPPLPCAFPRSHHDTRVLSSRHGILDVAAERVHDTNHGVQDHVVGIGALDLVPLLKLAGGGVVDVREAEGTESTVGLGKQQQQEGPGGGGEGLRVSTGKCPVGFWNGPGMAAAENTWKNILQHCCPQTGPQRSPQASPTMSANIHAHCFPDH